MGSISVTTTRAPLSLERLSAALADLAVPHHDGDLRRDHDVRGAVQSVDHGVPAPVDVVELGLGDRVVDVDRGEEERLAARHLVESVDAGGRLLRHAVNSLRSPLPAGAVDLLMPAQQLQDHAPLLGVRGRIERRNRARALELHALVHQQCGVAPVVENQVGAAAVGPGERLLGAPPVFLQGLALPREDCGTGRRVRGSVRPHGGCCCRVVLRGEDVARRPAHRRAQFDERLDQHGGLHRHVQRTHDPGAGERLQAIAVFLPDRHEPGHLVLGQADLVAAPLGQGQVGHLEGRPVDIGCGPVGAGDGGLHDSAPRVACNCSSCVQMRGSNLAVAGG